MTEPGKTQLEFQIPDGVSKVGSQKSHLFPRYLNTLDAESFSGNNDTAPRCHLTLSSTALSFFTDKKPPHLVPPTAKYNLFIPPRHVLQRMQPAQQQTSSQTKGRILSASNIVSPFRTEFLPPIQNYLTAQKLGRICQLSRGQQKTPRSNLICLTDFQLLLLRLRYIEEFLKFLIVRHFITELRQGLHKTVFSSLGWCCWILSQQK